MKGLPDRWRPGLIVEIGGSTKGLVQTMVEIVIQDLLIPSKGSRISKSRKIPRAKLQAVARKDLYSFVVGTLEIEYPEVGVRLSLPLLDSGSGTPSLA